MMHYQQNNDYYHFIELLFTLCMDVKMGKTNGKKCHCKASSNAVMLLNVFDCVALSVVCTSKTSGNHHCMHHGVALALRCLPKAHQSRGTATKSYQCSLDSRILKLLELNYCNLKDKGRFDCLS